MLAISVDSTYAHKIFAEREGYDFPLLADFWPHGGVAQDYGVFNDEAGFANRGTFLIDLEGVVRFAEMNAPGEGRDAQKLACRDRGAARLARWLALDWCRYPGAVVRGRLAQRKSTRLTPERSLVRSQ